MERLEDNATEEETTGTVAFERLKEQMKTSVVNPNESLAELYHQRRHCNNMITKLNAKDAPFAMIQEYTVKLWTVNQKISVAEKAMQTPGRQVRLF